MINTCQIIIDWFNNSLTILTLGAIIKYILIIHIVLNIFKVHVPHQQFMKVQVHIIKHILCTTLTFSKYKYHNEHFMKVQVQNVTLSQY